MALRLVKAENNQINSIGTLSFYGFFVLLSLAKGLGFYEGQKMFYLLVIPALLLGILKIITTRYTVCQAIVTAALLVLSGVVFAVTGELGILFLTLLVLGMKDIRTESVIRTALWVWSICAIVLSIVSFFNFENTIYRVHMKLGMGHIFRWSLGFTHPNILHITYLIICALIIFELGENFKLKDFGLMMAGNLLVFIYSVSYTGFGIVLILLFLRLYLIMRKKLGIFEKVLCNILLPLVIAFSFVLPLLLGLAPVDKLNEILNTRLTLASKFLNSTYISLFGTNLKGIIMPDMTMDNSYVWGLVNYGIIPFSVLMLLLMCLVAYLSVKGRDIDLIILVSFLAAGFTEPFLFNTSFKNITLVFLGAMIFEVTGRSEAEKIGFKPIYITAGLINRPLNFFLKMNAELPLKLKSLFKNRDIRKRAIIGIVLGAVIGGIMFGILYREPKGYYVRRSFTDAAYDEEDTTYIEDPAIYESEGYKVLNFADKATRMQLVDGRAVKLETIRYIIGSLLIGALTGGFVIYIAVLPNRKRKGNNNE